MNTQNVIGGDVRGIAINIAFKIFGHVEIQGEYGYCDCPGKHLHSQRDGKRDCRIAFAPIPWIQCFHQACRSVVEQTRKLFQREIFFAKKGIDPESKDWKKRTLTPEEEAVLNKKRSEGKIKARALRLKKEIFHAYKWDAIDARIESPIKDGNPYLHFLNLFRDDDIIWIGEVTDSGKEKHLANFKPVSEWKKVNKPIGNFTSGAVYKPGTFSRSNENVLGRPFLVVESDVLSRNQICCVFKWLSHYHQMHAIVDTGGKSLHGWFSMPNQDDLANLKIILPELGCDPALFKPSQPVRIPGAIRDGKPQNLVWFKN